MTDVRETCDNQFKHVWRPDFSYILPFVLSSPWWINSFASTCSCFLSSFYEFPNIKARILLEYFKNKKIININNFKITYTTTTHRPRQLRLKAFVFSFPAPLKSPSLLRMLGLWLILSSYSDSLCFFECNDCQTKSLVHSYFLVSVFALINKKRHQSPSFNGQIFSNLVFFLILHTFSYKLIYLTLKNESLGVPIVA